MLARLPLQAKYRGGQSQPFLLQWHWGGVCKAARSLNNGF